MSFFSNLFNWGKKKDYPQTPIGNKLREFDGWLKELLSSDKYIARSDYWNLLNDYDGPPVI